MVHSRKQLVILEKLGIQKNNQACSHTKYPGNNILSSQMIHIFSHSLHLHPIVGISMLLSPPNAPSSRTETNNQTSIHYCHSKTP